MQVLTPSGYVSPAALANGADVCAFDSATGAPIVNQVEDIGFVDYAEWCRWWENEESVPDFTWYRINGSYLLFREQSIWRNETNVCHVRHLVVGDVIYDDHDQPLTITSLETVEDHSLIWYRFDISGDHSYIIDGLTVHNASRFWVGGSGTWDSTTTTNWAASSGGAGGQSVPGSADTVTLDANVGTGNTVTLNFGGTVTIQSLTCGALVGTFDNSVNNNNMTLSLSGTSFGGTGSGARILKLGTSTTTLSGANATMTFATATNLTMNAGSATVSYTGSGARQYISGGAFTIGTLSIGASAGLGSWKYNVGSGSNTTFTNVNITAPNYIVVAVGTTLTVTNAVNWAGTSSSAIGFVSDTIGTQAGVSVGAGSTLQWSAIRDTLFTGSPTATNSLDLGHNSGITITGPSTSSGAVGVIGS